jgi:hypothetical protein
VAAVVEEAVVGEVAQILVANHRMSRVPEVRAVALNGVTVGTGLRMMNPTLLGAIEMDGFTFSMNQAILSCLLQRFVNTLNPLSRAPIILDARDMVVATINAIEAVVAQEPYWD